MRTREGSNPGHISMAKPTKTTQLQASCADNSLFFINFQTTFEVCKVRIELFRNMV